MQKCSKGHKTGKQWSCFRGRHWKYLEESKAGVEATAYLETLCLLMKGKTVMRECEGGLLLKHSHLLQSSWFSIQIIWRYTDSWNLQSYSFPWCEMSRCGGSSFSFLTSHFQSSAFSPCSKHPSLKFSSVRHPSPSFPPACTEQGAFGCWKRHLTDCSSQLGTRRSDRHRAILTSQCAFCNVRGLLLMLCWLYSLLWMNYAFKLGISLKIPPVT